MCTVPLRYVVIGKMFYLFNLLNIVSFKFLWIHATSYECNVKKKKKILHAIPEQVPIGPPKRLDTPLILITLLSRWCETVILKV